MNLYALYGLFFVAVSSPTFQAFFNNPFFLVPKKSFLGRFFCPEKNGFVFKRLSFSVWARQVRFKPTFTLIYNFVKSIYCSIRENSCHSCKLYTHTSSLFVKLSRYLIPENSCHSYKISYFCTTN